MRKSTETVRAIGDLWIVAEGTSMTDPTKTGKYEDHLELVTPDHKRITSFGLGEDGTWKQYMEVN